jgi:hypothetical protein
MASAPQFAGTVLMGAAAVSSSADTSYTAPTHAVSIVAAGASGSKIDEIRFQGIGTTIAGTITVFAYDGAAYHLVDAVLVPVVTASTTAPPWQLIKAYPNLVLSSGWTLYVATTVASQLVSVAAFGGSF